VRLGKFQFPHERISIPPTFSETLWRRVRKKKKKKVKESKRKIRKSEQKRMKTERYPYNHTSVERKKEKNGLWGQGKARAGAGEEEVFRYSFAFLLKCNISSVYVPKQRHKHVKSYNM
jgi:hypothetical protein